MADTYNKISNIAFVMAAIFFLCLLVLFFRFNIIKIIGDLSGRNARKAINEMKEKAETVRESMPNREVSLREIREDSASLDTELLDRDDTDATVFLDREDPDATVFLAREDSDATVLLDRQSEDKTEVLSDEAKTEILQVKLETKKSGFIVEKEILFIHTIEELQFRREYGSV